MIRFLPNYSSIRYILCIFLIGTTCCLVSTTKAQAPTIGAISQGSWTQVAQAPTDTWMHFPRGISFDILSGGAIVKKTLINWQTNSDVATGQMSHGWTGSVNDAATWNSPAATNAAYPTDVDMMGCIQRNTDGVMVAIPFYWAAGTTPPFTFPYRTSANKGNTWSQQSGTITGFPAGQLMGGFRFHRGIIQDPDGTLYAPAHAQWKRADGTYVEYRTMLLKSTDGGDTWNFVNTIQHTTDLSYTETSIVRCKDGSILAVMRNGSNALKYNRSTNNGITWSAVNFLPGLPANQGVDPFLQLLPNGILTLTYGNNMPVTSPSVARHCLVAFSPDGNGANWVNVTQTFTSAASGAANVTARNRSTGYTSIFPLRNNRVMQVTDRGDPRYYANVSPVDPHPTPNPFSVWSKPIDIVTNYRNRIDLKSKYAAVPKQADVSTDMTYADAIHPEAQTSGAFDASTDYWSGAFKAATSGYYTIDLQQDQMLNAMSICLLVGRAQGATIQYATNSAPSTWTTIKTYPSTTVHYTVDYFSFAPITARYIKVNVTSGSALASVGLNEINLFSAADTYEDYAYDGKPPYGYTVSDTASPDFWVSEGVVPLPSGYQSQRALYMFDNDSANKEISKTSYSASATKTLEFKLRTKGFATNGGIQFRLVSGSTDVFEMSVSTSGAIRYYHSGIWSNVGAGTPVVPFDTWKAIKVIADAPGNLASIYVDSVFVGYASKVTASATTMNGFLFASSGSAPVGDKALFDDVLLYDTPLTLMAQSVTSTAPAKSGVIIDKNIDPNSVFKIILSPNPASSMMSLIVNNAVNGKLSVRFTNMSRSIVKRINYILTDSTAKFEISVGDLLPGVYVVEAMQNNKVATAKLIKE
jgi:hypothetical protein